MCGEIHTKSPEIMVWAQQGMAHRGARARALRGLSAQPKVTIAECELEWYPVFYVTSHFLKIQVTFKYFESHTNPAIGHCLATLVEGIFGCQGLGKLVYSFPPNNPMWLARRRLTPFQTC